MAAKTEIVKHYVSFLIIFFVQFFNMIQYSTARKKKQVNNVF